jgi:hypothetical protein
MKNFPVVESIGLIAVFAGLIFVGLEIRQNNQLAQAAAYQEIGFATAQNWQDMSQDPDFNRLFLRHFYADSAWWADQDPRDIERLITLWIGYLRVYETIYLQIDLGLLDKDAIDRLGWGSLRELPALHYLWPHLGIVVDPAFSEHITKQWSEVPPLTTGLFIEP